MAVARDVARVMADAESHIGRLLAEVHGRADLKKNERSALNTILCQFLIVVIMNHPKASTKIFGTPHKISMDGWTIALTHFLGWEIVRSAWQ
jgi:hypothetical protein